MGKGNHHCESFGPLHLQPRPHSQGFPFVIAFKEASGRPEVSRRRRREKRSHYMVVREAVEFYDIGIQILIPRLNKFLDIAGDDVEK